MLKTTNGHQTLIEEMSERDFAEWLFFAPEVEDIFPLLEEEGLLPWDDWEEIIPDEDGILPDFDELFPEDDGFFDEACLPEEDCPLPDDGELPPDGDFPGEDDLPPADNPPPDGEDPLGIILTIYF